MKPETTVAALIDDAYARLKRARVAFGHGITNAWDEAVYLVLHALHVPPHRSPPDLKRAVGHADRRRVERLIDARILRRMPAAYLTHEAWLGDFRFYVDRRVIVPRSFIAELLQERLAPWIQRPAKIKRTLDLCTGSGCLAILAALAFPNTRVIGTDISRGALAVAQRNLADYKLRRRIRLIRSDLFEVVPQQRFDLILANPPYVSERAMRALPPEHRQEPELALAAGSDGFDVVRGILQQAHRFMAADGLLVVEVGHHRRRLERAFPRLPFLWPQTSAGDDCVFMLERRDLEHHVRDVTAARAQANRATRSGVGSRRRRAPGIVRV